MRNQIKVVSSAAVALIAHDLKISRGRVRQIIIKLKLKPVQKIGNVPFYSEEQVQLIRQRNRKPGPMKIDHSEVHPHAPYAGSPANSKPKKNGVLK